MLAIFIAGETATFEVQLKDKAANVVWLKGNKPLDDKLASRVDQKEMEQNVHRLEIKHCRSEDTGLYTAIANSETDAATCSAQLVVEECKSSISKMFVNLQFK